MTRLATVLVLLLVAAIVRRLRAVGRARSGRRPRPPATAEPSLEVPSGDATPDLSSPEPSTTPGPSALVVARRVRLADAPPRRPRPTATPRAARRRRRPSSAPTSSSAASPTTRASPRCCARSRRRRPSRPPPCASCWPARTSAEMGARPAMYTAIPDGTTLLGISIADGIATVNLSREFESGGGSASMQARLAQVVYTLTQFPTVTGVRFQLDGVAGDRARRRGHRPRTSPSAATTSATSCRRSSSTGRRGARASATRARSAARRTCSRRRSRSSCSTRAVARSLGKTVMASCGTGCWGTFRTSLAYTVDRGQWGTLRVFESSAQDGSPDRTSPSTRSGSRPPGSGRPARRYGAASSSRTAGSIRSVTQRRYWAPDGWSPSEATSVGSVAASPEIAKIPSTNRMWAASHRSRRTRSRGRSPRAARPGRRRPRPAASPCSRASRRTGSGPAGAARGAREDRVDVGAVGGLGHALDDVVDPDEERREVDRRVVVEPRQLAPDDASPRCSR